VLDSFAGYGSFSNTKDCSVNNCNFKYKMGTAFKGTYKSTNALEQSITFTADRPLGLEDGEVYNHSYYPDSFFGAVNITNTRSHIYISKYEMVSNADNTVKMYFASAKEYLKYISSIKNNGAILPMPTWGHRVERAFTVAKNTDFTMTNVDVINYSRFGFFLNQNEGTLTLDDVDFVSESKDLFFTGWRDGFHCKDNRAAIKWLNCDALGNYDDVINVSASALYVKAYDAATRQINIVWAEQGGGVYYTIKSGDTLRVINTSTGEDYGTAIVSKVIKQANGENIITLKSNLNITATGNNVAAYFVNRAAQGSVISNCNFNGTFRFRGGIDIVDSYIYNMRTWIDLHMGTTNGIDCVIEAPVPAHIHYKNCTIESGSGATIIIDSYNSNAGGYHINDVLFENCKLDSSTLSIGENDKPYVKLSGCTELS